MAPTVRDLLDAARVRHWSFTETELGDGAALLFLNQRQRTHLAQFGTAIEGLIGASVEHQIAPEGVALVALDDDGVPFYSTTSDTVYGIRFSDGVPYVDTEGTPLTRDPFGEEGGTPGFPLPNDLERLISVGLVYGTSGRIIPCDVIPERQRFTHLPGRNPAAFLSGGRLVPLFPLATGNTGDRWTQVTALQISYVALATLASTADVVTLPAVLCEALTADLALLFARQSRDCPPVDKRGFEADAAACLAAVRDAAIDLFDSVQATSVLYKP